VLVLATTMAAATAMFAVLTAVVLRPLPLADADRLVAIRHRVASEGPVDVGVSTGTYLHYRAHATSLESLATYMETVSARQMPEGGAERVHITYAGVSLFETLRVTPVLGRLFTAEDAAPGFMDMRWTIPVLLSHDFWMARFGGSPDVIGRILSINERPRRVIGILPPAFRFPRADTQIWMLMEPPARTAQVASDFDWQAVARLRPGVSIQSARHELTRLVALLEGAYPDATPERLAALQLTPFLRPLKLQIIGSAAGVLWPLFGAMLLLLLIGVLNTGGMFLVRAESRHQEMAVRQAIGASVSHIRRLFLIEALLLTAAAAAIGLTAADAIVAGTL
jgi:hypothetical protein